MAEICSELDLIATEELGCAVAEIANDGHFRSDALSLHKLANSIDDAVLTTY
jgi:hypothetical protein